MWRRCTSQLHCQFSNQEKCSSNEVAPEGKIICGCNTTKHNFNCHGHNPCLEGNMSHLFSSIFKIPSWSNPRLSIQLSKINPRRVEQLVTNQYIVIGGIHNCAFQGKMRKNGPLPHLGFKQIGFFCLSNGSFYAPKMINGHGSKFEDINPNT